MIRLRIAIALVSITGSGSHTAVAVADIAPPLIIDHVTLLPMTGGSDALSDMTVVIRKGRISAIGRATTDSTRGVRKVNAKGKWLIPALTDMHVHQENARTLQLLTGD